MDVGRIPHATRPKKMWYKVCGLLVADDAYLDESRRQFVGRGMQLARGMANPDDLSRLYDELMNDAGLRPIEAQTEPNQS